ncbi:unnamed protein product [Parascedosporium putredinis]|uniref:glycerol kinase n=1 Tax=Parascedosporium putredinis TaxID=1442378 RepID=A0A9P1MAL3_9PEZI|nr:unnamed protein product [Parascedosporium putredinis]CAI7994158.1 unnamed protein product [Parascedosporium putredinis]
MPSAYIERSNEPLIGAIDQGTTSSRFLVFNTNGDLIASHQLSFTQLYPRPGWHEHDPEELVSSVEECIDVAIDSLERLGPYSRDLIQAVGIANQRETTVVWDSETGKALHNAIVWTDARSQDIVHELRQRPGAEDLAARCGIPLSTYPSITKLLWLLDNAPEVQAAYERGTLAFGTVDSWLTYKLNGGVYRGVHVTDPSNASRTMFMDLESLKYDDDLLSWFGIDPTKIQLPRIVRSSDPESYGTLFGTSLRGVKITGCLGDQSAALVGQNGFSTGRAKNTYGTGCFLLCNVGPKPVLSEHGLLSTVAFDFGKGKAMYALEGSVAAAGSSVEFLKNSLGLIDSASDVTELAETVDDNGGCIFVTAFSGLFAPYWIHDARGTIFGLTGFTKKGHIARATLEATCFQTKAILDAMAKDSGRSLTDLAVDGGMCHSDLVMQTQADIIGIPVKRPMTLEATALGAAIAAGMAVGVWSSFEDLEKLEKSRAVFEPKITAKEASHRFARWEKAVEMSRGWLA